MPQLDKDMSNTRCCLVLPVWVLVRATLPCCALVMLAMNAVAAPRPNVVFIVTDDVGYGDLRPFNPDGRVSLPTIEEMANEGIVFTDAHTSAAKCAPSRYSIVTGNYQWRGRLPWGQWKYKGGSQIRGGQRTLGDMFRAAGYTSGFVGKYHLGANFYKKGSNTFVLGNAPDSDVDFTRPMREGALERGFDYSFLALRGIQDSPYAFFENDALLGSSEAMINWAVGDYGDTKIETAGIGLPSWNTRAVGDSLLSKAVGFIDSHRSRSTSPFFLYLNTQAVHSPYKPSLTLGQRSVLGASGLSLRGDLLVEVDAMLSEIELALQRHSIEDDTLVILASDNGGLNLYEERRQGHLVSGGLRGDKGTIYEGGHRVPLIMRWPNGFASLPAGTRINDLVGIQDLYATLADVLEVPLSDDEALDSISFAHLLNGETGVNRTNMAHEADAPEDGAADGIVGRHFAYRAGKWKLVMNSSNQAVGLYDLSADLGERSNALAGQGTLAAKMRDEFLAIRNGTRTRPAEDVPPPPPNNGSVFQQGLDGLVSIEAEHFSVPLTGWSATSLTGASNSMGIKAVAGPVTSDAVLDQRSEYRINFQRTGTHSVWLRMRAHDATSRYLRVGLNDGKPVYRPTPADGKWYWKALGTSVNVPTAGIHVIRIYRREQNVEVDKVVVATGSYTPSGTGPAESERE